MTGPEPEVSATEEPRPHQVNLSVSESDLEFLHEQSQRLRKETGRPVVPLASAAYVVFAAGRAAILEERAA